MDFPELIRTVTPLRVKYSGFLDNSIVKMCTEIVILSFNTSKPPYYGAQGSFRDEAVIIMIWQLTSVKSIEL